MSIAKAVKKGLHNSLLTFKLFEIVISAVCISIPIFLRLGDTGASSFRGSISDYAYMSHSYLFGMLLCMAAMLFIFNGAVYFKNYVHFQLSAYGTGYNVILGLSLLGVILFPYGEHRVVHYASATLFFVGNAVVMGIFHKEKNRVVSIILAILTVLFLGLWLLNYLAPSTHWLDWLTLFWAEWLSLTVIGIHFILESRGMSGSNNL